VPCSICRRTTGGAIVGWVTVNRTGFRFISGQPKSFPSSDFATRAFCPTCGTQLTFSFDEWPDFVDVTIRSSNDPNLVPPKDHTRISAQLPWLVVQDNVPRHLEAREMSGDG